MPSTPQQYNCCVVASWNVSLQETHSPLGSTLRALSVATCSCATKDAACCQQLSSNSLRRMDANMPEVDGSTPSISRGAKAATVAQATCVVARLMEKSHARPPAP
eukprot:CAMPEP_0183568462 /NCGR_PEP_ID=MMETSP0371-20130417/117366_1 /TAXON_ID=268820 /ORGANISM="Peridinium aciculiferum, Strain PAER-2" /LENGTH=104 /DNA_ID=CAMNT_0025777971 /DNA_START=157 /DNA_END=467 /DNA_ORIENTATION=-